MLALPTTAQAAAKPGVFAGTLGVTVPKGGHATVRAVEAAGGTVVAAKDVGRSGAFSLSLAPGPYVVRGVVVPRRGAIVTKAIAVSLKPGQRRTHTKLTTRKPLRPKKKTTRAQAAFVTERGNVQLGTVAVGIYPFAGPSGGELGAFASGFHDLLITDVLQQAATRCKGHVALREVARIADVLREFELGNSAYADKSTFPKRNLIIVDVAVRGTITQLPDGTARAVVTITDDRTGAKVGELDAPLGEDVFAGEEKLAGRLVDKLCNLSETFKVTLDVNGEGRFATHHATGTMHAVLLARRAGDEWTASGPLQWGNVGFTSKVDCPYVDIVVPVTTWSVKITDQGDGLSLTWSRDGNDSTSASIDCPPGGPDDPDPPPIPGQAGTALLTTGPQSFPLPYAGATTPISGVIQDGGDGFFNTGTITVRPAGVTAPS
ncbi:MAG: hypothetical protein JWO02_3707 [Solirubrobacterales bacterium]|nr:hypothetical protein [Solirubrobacterales bacterium]